jgi:hypothetical protein
MARKKLDVTDAALGGALREMYAKAEVDCKKCITGRRKHCWANQSRCLLDMTLDVYYRAVRQARRGKADGEKT